MLTNRPQLDFLSGISGYNNQVPATGIQTRPPDSMRNGVPTVALLTIAALAGFPHASAPAIQQPSEAEAQLRADKLIANQHRDDSAIERYERIEHQIDRTGGPSPRVTEDRTFRVVPTGTGTMKILLRDNGKTPNPADYHRQLEQWRDALELALKPDDSRAKSAFAKFDKKRKDRAEL